MTENTFYMAVAQFSETYGKFGMANDKLYVNQTDKICGWMPPDIQVPLQICHVTPQLVLVHHLYLNLTLEAFESVLQF